MNIKFLSFLELLMAIVVTLSGIACMYVGYHFVGIFDFIAAAFLAWAVIYNMVNTAIRKVKRSKYE